MIGEIRLGFFVDGIGYYKDCSELLYTIDSSSDSRYFKEGMVIEIDNAFFKVQAIELQYIDLPWEGKGEKPNRQKPVKMVYVNKAKVSMMGDKSKKAIVAINKIPELKPLPDFDISEIVDDTEYTVEEFKEDFPHLDKPVKKKRKTKAEKKLEKRFAKKDIDDLKALKKKKTKAISEPKKDEPPVRNMRRRIRTTDVMDMMGGNDAGKPKKAAKTVKKEKSKPVVKKTRKRRCKGCDKLFKNIDTHKCKELR